MQVLGECRINHLMEVVQITIPNPTKQRLVSMGLTEGAKVAVFSKNPHNAILLLEKTRIGIDNDLLQQIFVKEIDTQKLEWTTLDQLKAGQQTSVINIHGQGPIKRRLMDMGITKGTPLEVIKLAPLGDPIEIKIRGYNLTLRKDEAQLVLVLKEDENAQS